MPARQAANALPEQDKLRQQHAESQDQRTHFPRRPLGTLGNPAPVASQPPRQAPGNPGQPHTCEGQPPRQAPKNPGQPRTCGRPASAAGATRQMIRCHRGSISASVMPSFGAVVGVDGSRIAPSAPSRPSRRAVIAARADAAASTWIRSQGFMGYKTP